MALLNGSRKETAGAPGARPSAALLGNLHQCVVLAPTRTEATTNSPSWSSEFETGLGPTDHRSSWRTAEPSGGPRPSVRAGPAEIRLAVHRSVSFPRPSEGPTELTQHTAPNERVNVANGISYAYRRLGGREIRPGDLIVDASHAREEKEVVKRSRLQAGERSYELDGLRAIVDRPDI